MVYLKKVKIFLAPSFLIAPPKTTPGLDQPLQLSQHRCMFFPSNGLCFTATVHVLRLFKYLFLQEIQLSRAGKSSLPTN